MARATYIGTNSAQFSSGTSGYVSDATSRRVWFSLRADGSDGCYVHPSDVVVASDADLVECPRCGELAPIGGDCPGASCTAFRTWAAAHQDDPQGEAAESPRSAGDGSAEPFCACGRRWSECDGSRAGCHKATMGRATPRSPRARRRTDTARRLQHPPTCPPSSPSPCSTSPPTRQPRRRPARRRLFHRRHRPNQPRLGGRHRPGLFPWLGAAQKQDPSPGPGGTTRGRAESQRGRGDGRVPPVRRPRPDRRRLPVAEVRRLQGVGDAAPRRGADAMSLYAIGWTAWRLDRTGQLRISTGVSTSLAIDADQATGSVLRTLHKDWSPSDGWTHSTAIAEITADDVRRARRAANPEDPTP